MNGAPKMLRVTHWPNGVLWPEGPSRDFSAFHAVRHSLTHHLVDGLDSSWSYRFYDPYSAYRNESLHAGHLACPIAARGREINNVQWIPSKNVLDRMIHDLEQLSSEYNVIWWDSAIQCFPYVAKQLKRLFPLLILSFGDDLPGSSDIKTFPVAACFDVLIHAMYMWDFSKGLSVPQIYTAHGLSDCRFISWGPLHQFSDEWFATKLKRLLANQLPVSLIWMGSIGIAPHRRDTLKLLMGAGITNSRFYGNGMRDGYFTGEPAIQYEWSQFGLNIAESSLFNGRFSDLCMSGTIQIAYDLHHELARFGFIDGKHYINFDGTANDLLSKINEYKKNPERLASIAEAARKHYLRFLITHGNTEVEARILLDYEKQIREGR